MNRLNDTSCSQMDKKKKPSGTWNELRKIRLSVRV